MSHTPVPEHTPTPWRVMPKAPSGGVYITGDETFQFDGRVCQQHVALTTKNYGDNTSSVRIGREEANAAFIVRAVNSHQRLVEALGEVMEWIDNWSPPFADDDEWPDTEEKARAALRAAEGETQ